MTLPPWVGANEPAYRRIIRVKMKQGNGEEGGWVGRSGELVGQTARRRYWGGPCRRNNQENLF